ncbi:MAG: sigma-70 family RNA polymerase sigma factor [Chloroflexia bacterium]
MIAVSTRTKTTTSPQSSIIAPIQKRDAVSAEDRRIALREVYDRSLEQIYKFVYFKVGNREDAEDIVSQVFMKAANSLDVTQQEHVRLAWLYQVARTTITDHWRNYYKGPVTSLEEMEEKAPIHFAADPIRLNGDIEEIEPAIAKVQAVLQTLPDNYRRVLELRFLQGCSLKETAEAIGITEGNAKVIQHRALQKAVKTGAQFI